MCRLQCDNRRGVVIVWVAVALVALLGMAALTIDVGQLCITAQTAQDAVDAAALAGASQLPDLSEATDEAELYVAANNEGQGFEVELTPGDGVVYYAPGDTVPGYGQLNTDTHAIEVTGEVEVGYTFARVFGLETAVVTRSAVATVTIPSTCWPAIFAGSTDPSDWGLRWSGAGGQIDGDVHSNCKVKISGAGHVITGVTEHVSGIQVTGAGNQLLGGIQVGSIEPYPLDPIPRSEVEPDTFDYYYGNYKLSGANKTVPSGRYYCTGYFQTSGAGIHGDNVIVVAEGDIKISGAGTTFTNSIFIAGDDINISGAGGTFEPCLLWAHDRINISGAGHTLPALDTVFAYSESTYQYAISISGAGNACEGTIFAPNGGIKYSGAGNGVQRGSLVAETIKISGAGFQIHGTKGGGGTGSVQISLVR